MSGTLFSYRVGAKSSQNSPIFLLGNNSRTHFCHSVLLGSNFAPPGQKRMLAKGFDIYIYIRASFRMSGHME